MGFSLDGIIYHYSEKYRITERSLYMSDYSLGESLASEIEMLCKTEDPENRELIADYCMERVEIMRENNELKSWVSEYGDSFGIIDRNYLIEQLRKISENGESASFKIE